MNGGQKLLQLIVKYRRMTTFLLKNWEVICKYSDYFEDLGLMGEGLIDRSKFEFIFFLCRFLVFISCN